MKIQPMKNIKIEAHAKSVARCLWRLEHMMHYQSKLNAKFYPIVMKNLGIKRMDRERLTDVYLTALIQEAAEARDLINWKPWKQGKIKVDEIEFKYEAVDILHFLFTICDLWNISAKELYELYMNKNRENHARIQRKY